MDLLGLLWLIVWCKGGEFGKRANYLFALLNYITSITDFPRLQAHIQYTGCPKAPIPLTLNKYKLINELTGTFMRRNEGLFGASENFTIDSKIGDGGGGLKTLLKVQNPIEWYHIFNVLIK